MSTTHAADHPGLDKSNFSASLVETPGAEHSLTVTGEATGDYRVEQVELVRAHLQPTPTTLVLDVKTKLGPVENPHPDFERSFALKFAEMPAHHRYRHVEIINGGDRFTVDVIDVL